jgi:hypothetical protein
LPRLSTDQTVNRPIGLRANVVIVKHNSGPASEINLREAEDRRGRQIGHIGDDGAIGVVDRRAIGSRSRLVCERR